jgi:deoxyribonuclease-4
MGEIRFGPARVLSRESPGEAIELLRERGYSANEIDFATGFWMDYSWAEEFGKLARRRKIALSVHAPIAGFMGHLERDRKHGMATGMLDHSAGIAKAAGAEPVVFHPGFLLGRTRKETVSSVVSQLTDLRKRLEGKDRAVAFGIEVMGRVNDFGNLEEVLAVSRLEWVRPVIDFAHLHATSDGAFTTVKAFHDVLSAANRVLPRGAPFHIHFSDIAYANRNETKHLPYGEGTLRAEPLGKALARLSRPATVISEAPGEESHQAIRAELFSAAGLSSPRRSSTRSASSSRPRSRKN